MADAGAIAVVRLAARPMPLPVWAAGNRIVSVLMPQQDQRVMLAPYVASTETLHLFPCRGIIRGTVQDGDDPVTNKLVVLIHRSSMRVVASTRSQEDGSFEFRDIYDDAQYLALAVDATRQAPTRNAVVADYLTPVLT